MFAEHVTREKENRRTPHHRLAEAFLRGRWPGCHAAFPAAPSPRWGLALSVWPGSQEHLLFTDLQLLGLPCRRSCDTAGSDWVPGEREGGAVGGVCPGGGKHSRTGLAEKLKVSRAHGIMDKKI